MAKFCDDECKYQGAICDFCKKYQDEYRDIKKLKDDKGKLKFAGDGICSIDRHEVSATDGYNCDWFECFLIKD